MATLPPYRMPPRPSAQPAEHSIFDGVHGYAATDESTLDLDGDPTIPIMVLGDDDIEVVLDFDTTQPIPPAASAPALPTHWSQLPAEVLAGGHFSTDGWTS